MTRRLPLSAVLFGLAMPLGATSREAVPVTGVLLDMHSAPVPSATVMLIRWVGNGDPESYETLARAVTDKKGRFSFGPVDPYTEPKVPFLANLFPPTHDHALYHVWMSDGQERVLESVDVTNVRGKDNTVKAVKLKMTVR